MIVAKPTPVPTPSPKPAVRPVQVYGDSLVVQARAQVRGAQVLSFPGTNVCDWLGQMKQHAAANPRRVVLVFSGNMWSQIKGYKAYGVLYPATEQAKCIAKVRQIFPASTQLVVYSPVACKSEAVPNGSRAFAYFWYLTARTLPNTVWSTAADDALTPGHVYRQADARGLLRAPDGVHLAGAGFAVFGGAINRATG